MLAIHNQTFRCVNFVEDSAPVDGASIDANVSALSSKQDSEQVGCRVILPYQKILDHERLYCEFAKVKCLAYDQCRSIVLRRDIHRHQANCRHVQMESSMLNIMPDTPTIDYSHHQRAAQQVQRDEQSEVAPMGFLQQENERLRAELEAANGESQQKEQIIQTLQEKINNL